MVLAVCLFAIVIVMGGCSEWWEEELTPMEKLAGTYLLVEVEIVQGRSVVEGPESGKLQLRPEGNGWIVTGVDKDGDAIGNAGPTWTADATTITFIDSDGNRSVQDYTLEGKLLTKTEIDDDYAAIFEKWRKTD